MVQIQVNLDRNSMLTVVLHIQLEAFIWMIKNHIVDLSCTVILKPIDFNLRECINRNKKQPKITSSHQNR